MYVIGDITRFWSGITQFWDLTLSSQIQHFREGLHRENGNQGICGGEGLAC